MIRPDARRGAALVLAWLAGLAPAAAQPTFDEPARVPPAAEQLAEIAAKADALEAALAPLRGRPEHDDPRTGEPLADAAVCLKAARWIVRFGEFYKPEYAGMTLKALETGRRRAEALAAGNHPWTGAKGATVRGYVSAVDGSVQPYAIVVPDGYDFAGEDRARLDVVLHGRDQTLNEVKFLAAHDGKPAPADQPGLVLHVFGRGNNAYRWAGEADVFEAIAAVRRNYRVDPARILLRGFSMGGAGAWHLGLHHPDRWAAVEAGAGFTESKAYAKLGPLRPDVEKCLHVYDAVDYAANAFDVPMAGYGGEDDPQLRASQNIRQALEAFGVPMKTEGLVTRAEGIDFLHVIGAKTGHKVDAESAKVLRSFADDHAARGIAPRPARIRFVTYTLKYPRCHWLVIERLDEHYKAATVEAEIKDDVVHITKADNVRILAIDRDAGETIRFGDQEFPLRSAVKGLLPRVDFLRTEEGWRLLDYDASRALQENVKGEKRPGLQGPIDDAFTAPFVCVRGTGTPWNPRVQEWADARLKAFSEVWARSLRGELPVKDDRAVTVDELDSKHLILFGDPGSNNLILRALPDLPLTWTRDRIALGGSFPSADHAPALVATSRLNPHRYVVLNSGHTFGAGAFAGTNALLYPRVGDFAVFALDGKDTIASSGLFDEGWSARP